MSLLPLTVLPPLHTQPFPHFLFPFLKKKKKQAFTWSGVFHKNKKIKLTAPWGIRQPRGASPTHVLITEPSLLEVPLLLTKEPEATTAPLHR